MLVDKTRGFIEEANDMKRLCMREMIPNIFEDMDEKGFALCAKLFHMLDTSMDLVLEQAKTIERIERKLDRLDLIDNKLDCLLERQES